MRAKQSTSRDRNILIGNIKHETKRRRSLTLEYDPEDQQAVRWQGR